MNKIVEKAYAKINLGLKILGKRSDGYHEVSMIMQSVSLSDELIIEKGHGIEIVTDAAGLSCGSDNLVYKAAALLAEKYKITPNVHITLNKKIFMAAGLAGGSSDAAAALRGLNKFWELGLDKGELEKIAAEIGSDVPFCITGGTALAKGRGEIITPLPEMPPTVVVLAKPRNLEVSTAWVYKNYDKNRVVNMPCIWNMMEKVSKGGHAITSCMGNVLETVTIPAYPQIASVKSAMLGAGAYYAMMSGSGPTVFAFTDDHETAEKVIRNLKEFDVETAIASTVGRIEI